MFSQRLKQLRADKSINQIQLAQKMGVAQGTVGKWETDKRVPDANMLRKLASFFNVPIDYLLQKEQTPEVLFLTRLSGLSESEKSKLLNEFSDTIDSYLEAKKTII